MITHFWLISKYLLLIGLVGTFSCERFRRDKAGSEMSAEEIRLAALSRPCNPDSFDLSCMQSEETELTDAVISTLGGLKDNLVKGSGDQIGIDKEEEYGDEALKEIRAEGHILPKHAEQSRLEGILHKLLAARAVHSERDYHVYVIEDPAVNAFTIGAEIFVTTSLLAEVESTDELACVIGHEIGHNELGHLAGMIKEREFATGIFGEDAGNVIANVTGLLTMSFNQLHEAAADLYGIDLALACGFDPCKGIDFWDRLSKQEGPASEWDNLLRSHPYSTRRAKCYRSHLADAHDHACK